MTSVFEEGMRDTEFHVETGFEHPREDVPDGRNTVHVVERVFEVRAWAKCSSNVVSAAGEMVSNRCTWRARVFSDCLSFIAALFAA